jgi:hypothetical protein
VVGGKSVDQLTLVISGGEYEIGCSSVASLSMILSMMHSIGTGKYVAHIGYVHDLYRHVVCLTHKSVRA